MATLEKILITKKKEDEVWMSVSDMMAGLMLIFLFIAIINIREVLNKKNEVKDTQEKICDEIRKEFLEIKEEWQMSICEGGIIIRFANEIIFQQGEYKITLKFKKILNEFFPRFMNIVWVNKEKISELRIEGHTSSEGQINMDTFDAYLYNTRLSQNRSREVMTYVLSIPSIKSDENYLKWYYKNLTAHGLSSSKLLLNEDKKENAKASRRVEFRIKTTAQDTLIEINEN